MEDLTKKYKKLSPIEHVLLKPGMYVGDIDIRTDTQFILSKVPQRRLKNRTTNMHFKIIF